jgi:superfamily I DNA/RNA helicase
VLLLKCGPRELCARLAMLLHRLPGSRAAFPTGIHTPPAGKQAWVAPLAVLGWMRELCIHNAAAARDVITHAEAVLGHQHAALRGQNRHGLHAAVSWALLSSKFFQDLQLRSMQVLDEHQRDAATYAEHTPLLIAAGPGAGKTRTISARALYIQAKRVGLQTAMQTSMQAEDVVAVTFTRRAKDDLVKKLREESGGPMPTVATMDAFMLGLISEVRRLANKYHSAWLPPVTNFLILADEDVHSITQKVPVTLLGGATMPTLQAMLVNILSSEEAAKQDAKVLNAAAVEVLRALVVEYRLERRMLRDLPSPELSARIGRRFEIAQTTQDRDGVAQGQLPGLYSTDGEPAQSLHNHLTTLCTLVREGDLYSFDCDKEPLALALFSSPIGEAGLACAPPEWTRLPQVQNAVTMWRETHSQTHYVVDEFQDTSPAQLAVFALLCNQTRLTVVGDSDQAIYAFRGANYAQLEGAFNALRPAGAARTLRYNYRSTSHIVAVSSAVISPNYAESGGQKDLLAHRDVNEDYKVYVIKGSFHTEHHAMMLDQITKWKSAGLPLHKIACLFHSRNQQLKFADFLTKKKFADFRALAISPAGDATEESKEQVNDGKVVLSTVHGAKGLEWEVVFIYAFDTAEFVLNNFPDPDPQELRRMLYVGCSRPRSLLYIHYEKEKNIFIAPVLAMRCDHIQKVDLGGKKGSAAGPLLELHNLELSVQRLTAGRLQPVYCEGEEE